MRLKRWPIVVAVFAATALFASVAVAGNAHFVGSRSCYQSGSTLYCSFKVAGLGNISTATVTVQAAFSCTKTTNGQQYVQPGGLASSSESNVPVTNGQITVTDFAVTGGSCPDGFSPTFTSPATVIVNGETIGTISF